MTKRFLIKIYNQIHRDNRDCIIAVCGGTGSGKSTIALWLAETLDTNYQGNTRFSSERIVFGFSEWIEALKKSHPYGTAMILEEPQAYFNSRMFSSKTNLDAVTRFSTGRIFQYLTILTYPSFLRIDSQIRERIHYVIETDGIDRDRKLNYWVPKKISENFNPALGVWKDPQTFTENGSRKMMRCVSPMPSKKLWDEYYARSREWKRLVKEGKISRTGDPLELNALENNRELSFQRRINETRQRDLRLIEEKDLWDIQDVRGLVKKGLNYIQANRIKALLDEHRLASTRVDRANEYHSELDSRQ